MQKKFSFISLILLAVQMSSAAADERAYDLCRQQSTVFEESLKTRGQPDMSPEQIRSAVDLSMESCLKSMKKTQNTTQKQTPTTPKDSETTADSPATSDSGTSGSETNTSKSGDSFTDYWLRGNPNKDGNKRLKRLK